MTRQHPPAGPGRAPPPELEREARDWLIRLTAAPPDPELVEAARRWAGRSPAHAAAFARARRLWRLAGAVPARNPWPRRAAAALVLAGAGWLALPPDWSADYRSGTGAIRHVQLADGSSALLNARSAIDVDYDGRARAIHLRRGEALFRVRPDPDRPFRVRDAALTATALGTTYAVRRHAGHTEVLVSEGRVAVTTPRGGRATLGPGDRARVVDGQLSLERGVDAGAALAWQRGRLEFHQAPLAEVVAALNQHRPGHILIADAGLETLPVSGVFQLDQLDDALATLEALLPLQQRRFTAALVVLSRAED